MKQLYFKATPQYGDLWMEQILVEYVYPILSVLVDENNGRYLCLCYNTINRQEWVVVPTSKQKLIALLRNQITIRDPFTSGVSQVMLVERCYETGLETTRMGRITGVPEDALPEDGEYMDAEPTEWDEYISRLEKENEASVTYSYTFLTVQKNYRMRLRSQKELVPYVGRSDDVLSRRAVCFA